MKLDDEGCLSFEVVGKRETEAYCSVVVEFNESNLEENRGTLGQTRVEYPYLETQISLVARKYGRTQMQRGLKLLQRGWT